MEDNNMHREPSVHTRSRSETLQRAFSRSNKHIISSWKIDDYAKIANAGFEILAVVGFYIVLFGLKRIISQQQFDFIQIEQ